MNRDDVKHKEIDLTQILDRLNEPKPDIEIDPVKKIKILKHRARMLSRKPEHIKEHEDTIELVEFVLAYENYAIESVYISEVYPLKEFVTIPCTPDFVVGIINVRGRIISIIDLKKIFDLPEKGIADFNKIIIIKSELNEFGIVADSITGVRSIPVNEIQTSMSTLTGVRERYLKGVLKNRIIFLDAAKILSDTNIIVHENVKS